MRARFLRERRFTPRAKVNNGWKGGCLVSAVLTNTVSRYQRFQSLSLYRKSASHWLDICAHPNSFGKGGTRFEDRYPAIKLPEFDIIDVS